MGLQGLEPVASVLATHEAMTDVIVMGNHVGDEGAKSISTNAQQNPNSSLKMVDMRYCDVAGPGMVELKCDHISTTPRLEECISGG
eukprot:scaffold853_cov386-Prasinococcus_capsulatus_cf.AAC.15